jgi:hypothetical protein
MVIILKVKAFERKEMLTSQIAQILKGSIEYTLLGCGSTVLVCHGISSNCFSTEVTKPLVETGFRLLRPSRP